ncbi:hypothetical protein SAMN05428970_2632 [Agromyces sp. CF514]|nr:hypothetical protein SAMN05428970_2632 [Agromyces sp. CF514]
MRGAPPVHGDGARSRVTFTAFDSVDDPMLAAWGRFRFQLLESTEPPVADLRAEVRRAPASVSVVAAHGRTSDAQAGLWRLLASNNRELGRSSLLYGTHAAARNHVLRLQAASDDLKVVAVGGPVNASHGWVVSLADRPVMTCSRWYSSTSTSIASAIGALAALRTAVLSEDVDRSAPSRRFSRRATVRSDVGRW